jgi:gluconolactonase
VSLYEHKQWDMVIGGLRFPEGPVVHFGTLACVELEDGNIWWMRDGDLHRTTVGGRPNGSAFGRTNEHLIVTDAGRNAILSVDLAAGTTEVIDAKGLRGPNELLVEDEVVTFTDPGKSSLRNRIGRVLRLEHGELQVLAEGLAFPNGIARHVDGRLFVAETRTGRILIVQRGMVSVWAEALPTSDGHGEPDGLAFLPNGLLAVALYGAGQIRVLGPDPRDQLHLSTPGGRPTNLCHDGSNLYCTEVDTGALWRRPLSDLGI